MSAAPPPSDLSTKETPYQLSQFSLAAFSKSGFNDPDPAVTTIVLEGFLASTNISISTLIDPGASLDAISHDFACKHGLAFLSLKQSSAAILPNGAKIALSHKCRIPLRLSSSFFTYVNAFVIPLTSTDMILNAFWSRHLSFLLPVTFLQP